MNELISSSSIFLDVIKSPSMPLIDAHGFKIFGDGLSSKSEEEFFMALFIDVFVTVFTQDYRNNYRARKLGVIREFPSEST